MRVECLLHMTRKGSRPSINTRCLDPASTMAAPRGHTASTLLCLMHCSLFTTAITLRVHSQPFTQQAPIVFRALSVPDHPPLSSDLFSPARKAAGNPRPARLERPRPEAAGQ